jgi:hypothetical protein
MTNAQKYLKDGVDIREFVNEYADYYVEETVKGPVVIRVNLKKFLEEQVQPTLTEDERVILRNIKNYNFIARDRGNDLYVSNKTGIHSEYIGGLFGSLFQFIKERRRISYRGVVKMMTNEERNILKEFEDCDTITRLDINKFRITKGKESHLFCTDMQGTLGRKHPKGFKGLLGNLRKNMKYKIKELLNDR